MKTWVGSLLVSLPACGPSPLVESEGSMQTPSEDEPPASSPVPPVPPVPPEEPGTTDEGGDEPPSSFIEVATFHVAGQLVTTGSEVAVDVALHLVAPLEGARDGQQTDFSFAGTLDAASGPSSITTTCPEAAAAERFELGVVDGAPAARLALEDVGPDTYVWMLFDATP